MLVEDFYETLNGCEKGRKYLELVTCVKNYSDEEPLEKHHIHPRAMGGSNKKENLVALSYFHHTLAHYYLAYIFRNQATCGAFRMMCDLKLEQIDLENKNHLLQLEHFSRLRALGRVKSPEQIKHQSESARGKIQITNGIEEKKIKPEFLEEYIAQGWRKGRCFKICSTQGLHWIHKEKISKKVSDEDLEFYLQEGWVRGRKTEETTRGKIRVSKGREVRYATTETLETLLQEGWVKGAPRGRKKVISQDGKISYRFMY